MEEYAHFKHVSAKEVKPVIDHFPNVFPFFRSTSSHSASSKTRYVICEPGTRLLMFSAALARRVIRILGDIVLMCSLKILKTKIEKKSYSH